MSNFSLTKSALELSKADQTLAAKIIRNGQQTLKQPIQDGDTLLIDFFAGTGGASQGFVLAGFKPVLIVEGDKNKRIQYADNFPTDYDVFYRTVNEGNEKPHLVYETTKEKDTEIILNLLKRKVGDKKVTYHVHASPSCVELCNSNRRKREIGQKAKRTKSNEFSDSEGTLKWTAYVLSEMKKKFGDKMTWSVEEHRSAAGGKKKKDLDIPEIRSKFPEHTANVWDFSLFGVPQDRKRAILLDKRLDIGKLPPVEAPNMDEVDDPYLTGLIEKVYSREVQSDERKYSGSTKVSMKGRIGIADAFALAGERLPENVQCMRSQSTTAQVATRLREQNYERKAWLNLINALKKATTLEAYLEKARNQNSNLETIRALKETVIQFVKDNKAKGKEEVLNMAKKEYARIYEQLTILAKTDLVMFIKSCDEEKRKKIVPIKEVQEYVKKAHEWLKDVDIEQAKAFFEAEIRTYNKDKRIDKTYAFAAGTANLANIDVQEILNDPVFSTQLYAKNIKEKIEKIVREKQGKTKMFHLNEFFGFKIVRDYSKNVLSNGKFLFSTEELPLKTRPLWAPAYVIVKGFDNDWGTSLFKKDSKELYDTERLWYPKEFKFLKMTPMHLRILGAFPLNFKFNGPVEESNRTPEQVVNEERKQARIAVGDSVPPLITLRLGLLINKVKPVSNQVALHATYKFTPQLTDFMHDLLDGFSEFLKRYKTKQNKRLAPPTKRLYKSIASNWFATHEFLSKNGMIVHQEFPREGRRKSDNRQKIPAQGGSPESAVNRLWIAYLKEELAQYETNKDFSRLNKNNLKEYIEEKELLNREKYYEFQRFSHPDRRLIDTKRRLSIEKENQKRYGLKEETINKIMEGDEVRRQIAKIVIPLLDQRGEKRKNTDAGPSDGGAGSSGMKPVSKKQKKTSLWNSSYMYGENVWKNDLRKERNWKVQKKNMNGEMVEVVQFMRRGIGPVEEEWQDWFFVKKSNIPNAGEGLFAARDFPAPKKPKRFSTTKRYFTVAFYEGDVYDNKPPTKDYVLQLKQNKKKVWVDGKGLANFNRTGKINDSRRKQGFSYNVRFKENGEIIVLKKIEKGQELYINYGDEYWEVESEQSDEADIGSEEVIDLTFSDDETTNAYLNSFQKLKF